MRLAGAFPFRNPFTSTSFASFLQYLSISSFTSSGGISKTSFFCEPPKSSTTAFMIFSLLTLLFDKRSAVSNLRSGTQRSRALRIHPPRCTGWECRFEPPRRPNGTKFVLTPQTNHRFRCKQIMISNSYIIFSKVMQRDKSKRSVVNHLQTGSSNSCRQEKTQNNNFMRMGVKQRIPPGYQPLNAHSPGMSHLVREGGFEPPRLPAGS